MRTLFIVPVRNRTAAYGRTQCRTHFTPIQSFPGSFLDTADGSSMECVLVCHCMRRYWSVLGSCGERGRWNIHKPGTRKEPRLFRMFGVLGLSQAIICRHLGLALGHCRQAPQLIRAGPAYRQTRRVGTSLRWEGGSYIRTRYGGVSYIHTC
jgi:hypothetical protein